MMQAYALTDPGKIRNINQDYIYVSNEPVGPLNNLFLLADGMGGQRAGDFASRYVVEHVVETLMSSEEKDCSELLVESINQANRSLYTKAESDPALEGTGTTLVAASIQGNVLHVANVGDSRLYLLRDSMEQITRDHSYVEEMVQMGRMQRGSIDYQKKKNIITRAVGVGPYVNADIFVRKLMTGDMLLLCSDGLTNMVDEMEIEYILRSEGDLTNKSKLLIEAANRNGGKDNISVVLVKPLIAGNASHAVRDKNGEVEAC